MGKKKGRIKEENDFAPTSCVTIQRRMPVLSRQQATVIYGGLMSACKDILRPLFFFPRFYNLRLFLRPRDLAIYVISVSGGGYLRAVKHSFDIPRGSRERFVVLLWILI